jgi:hypothetical protein
VKATASSAPRLWLAGAAIPREVDMNHSVGLPDQAARVSTLPVYQSAAATIRSSGENVSAPAISHISCHYLLRLIRSAARPAGAICRSSLCGFLPFARASAGN